MREGAKSVTTAVVRTARQLRRYERPERNVRVPIENKYGGQEVEASENQLIFQKMSETQRSEA
jgi:hypothetical protein